MNTGHAQLPYSFNHCGVIHRLTELYIKDDVLFITLEPPSQEVESAIREVMEPDLLKRFSADRIQKLLNSK